MGNQYYAYDETSITLCNCGNRAFCGVITIINFQK